MTSFVHFLKKIAFSIVLLFLSWLFLEAVSFCTYAVLKRQVFSWEHYAVERTAYPKQAIAGLSLDEHDSMEVLHPYLGYVFNPAANKMNGLAYPVPITSFGFFGKESPIHQASSNRLIIGVTGGSFAGGFVHAGRDVLTELLRASLSFEDKEIVYVPLALGGYKQPQQLLTLSYLLSLRAHFDVLINMDGFNEVALPPVENVPKGVFPFFPRMWFHWVNQRPNPKYLLSLADTQQLVERRNRYAESFSRRPLRYSVLMNVWWKWMDMRLTERISHALLVAQELTVHRDEGSFAATGPPRRYDTQAALYEDLAHVWKESSMQMNALCEANGIAYYHFLQPNQYVEGSKPMGREELEIAYLDDHPYKAGVEMGYPYLLEKGRELVAAGVSFEDLTMVFSEVDAPLYMDTCCHVLYEGYEMIARHVGETILRKQGEVVGEF